MSRILVVSGTGTDVGKTIVTAAIASNALRAGRRVSVIKPGQTGVVGEEPGDLERIAALAADADGAGHLLTLHELARFPDPLAPAAAARVRGLPPLGLDETVSAVSERAEVDDLVLVEGAGGLLVRYSDAPAWTIADVAAALDAPVLLVVNAALGTLHHTASTLESLAARGLTCSGLVIGSWPQEPGLAERTNLTDLDALGHELARTGLVGAMPADAAALAPAGFAEVSAAGLSPDLGGTFDAAHFVETYEPEIPL